MKKVLNAFLFQFQRHYNWHGNAFSSNKWNLLINISNVMHEQVVSIEELRSSLKNSIGSNTSLHIKKKNNELIVGFIRGFADAQCNVITVSEQSDSTSMRIIDIRQITEIEYIAFQETGLNSTILRAKS